MKKLILTLALLFLTTLTYGSITYDNGVATEGANGTKVTSGTFAIASQSNKFLIVSVWTNGSVTNLKCYHGTVTLTAVSGGTVTTGPNSSITMFYEDEPASGASEVVSATWTTSRVSAIMATNYYGVDTIGAITNRSLTTSPYNLTITTTASNSYHVTHIGYNNSTAFTTTTGTERLNTSIANNQSNAAADLLVSAAGLSTISFTGSNANVVAVSVELLNFVPTPTITETITPTWTITQTVTPTITQTITPGFNISKSANPSTANNGDTVTYTINWSVTGYITNLNVRDYFDAKFNVLGASPVGVNLGDHYSWSIGTVNSGASATYYLWGNLSTGGSLVPIANQADEYDGISPKATVQITVPINTYTITPTITKTITKTVSPTITPSITVTTTPTITQTITQTVTPTITLTSTPTTVPLHWRVLGGAKNDIAYVCYSLSDGNVLIAGSTESFGPSGKNIYLAKLSGTDLSTIWEKNYGNTGDIEIFDAKENTTTGNIACIGYTNYGAGTGNIVQLFIIDTDGNCLTSKTFGNPNHDTEGESIIPTGHDNGWYINGFTNDTPNGNYQDYFLYVNQSGGLVASSLYGWPTGDTYGQDIALDNSGNGYLTGYTNSIGAGGYDQYVIKTDNAGNCITAASFGTTKDEYLYTTYYDSIGNDLLTCGWQVLNDGFGTVKSYNVHIELDLSVEWTRNNGVIGNQRYAHWAQPYLGNYMIAGSNTYGSAGNADARITEVNDAGATLFDKLYGGVNEDSFWSICHPGSKIVGAGYTYSYSVGGGAPDGYSHIYVVMENDYFMPTPSVTPTITQTWTVTETITVTNTQTITQTMTQTITKTITQTITQTATQTVTQTITPNWIVTVTANQINYNVGDIAIFNVHWEYTGYIPYGTLYNYYDSQGGTYPQAAHFYSATPGTGIDDTFQYVWPISGGTNQSGDYSVHVTISEPTGGHPWHLINEGGMSAVTGATRYAFKQVGIYTYTPTNTYTPTYTPTETSTHTFTETPTFTPQPLIWLSAWQH